MDRIDALRALVAAVDTGGFAAAARKLGVSALAVTRAIAQIEAEQGVRLFTRTTRVVRATEAGQHYAEDCRRILAELDDADAALRGRHAHPQGRLVVTAPLIFGRLYVMPIVTRYLGQHPQVDVSCLFLDRVVQLVDEGVDVGVRIGALADTGLRAVPVGQVRRMLVAAPGYLAARGAPTTPQALAGHQLISAGTADSALVAAGRAMRWTLRTEGVEQDWPVHARLHTTDNEAAIQAALAGFGITRVVSYQVDELLHQGQLQQVLPGTEPAPLPVHVVHRQGPRMPVKTRAFLDLAISSLRADPRLNPGG